MYKKHHFPKDLLKKRLLLTLLSKVHGRAINKNDSWGRSTCCFWWLMAYFLRIIPWLGYVGKPTMMSFRPLSRISDYIIHGLVSQNGGTPKSSNLIGISIIFTIQVGVLRVLFLETSTWLGFHPFTLTPPRCKLQFWTPRPLPEASWTHPKDQFHGCLFLRRITTTFDRWIRHLDLGIHGDWGWAVWGGGWEKTLKKMWATRKKTTLVNLFFIF